MPNLHTIYQSYTKDTARAYQVFQLARFASVLVAGMLLVKLGYTGIEVSNFEWFLFSVHALSFFWLMGLKNALLSYWPELEDQQAKTLLGSLFISFILISVLVAAAAYYTYLGTSSWFIVFFALSVPASLAEQYLLLNKQSSTLFHYGIWLHLLYVLLVAIFSFSYQSSDYAIQYIFIALVIWAAIRFVYTVYLFYGNTIWKIDWQVLKPFLVFALPIVLYLAFGIGMDVLDGFLVEYFFDPELFAKYRYGAKELPITALLIGALATATIPLAVTKFDEAISEMRKRLSKLMNWMFPLTILLMLTSPFLYRFFYSEAYVLSAHVFNIYLLIIISRILTPQVLLYALKENKVLMYVSVIELLVNLGLSLWFMSLFGMFGIAYATLIAYTLEKILLVGYLYFAKGIPPTTYINVPKYAVWSVILIATYITSTLYLY